MGGWVLLCFLGGVSVWVCGFLGGVSVWVLVFKCG